MFLWKWTPLPNNIISLLFLPQSPTAPYRYSKIKLSFRLYSICLSFFVSDLIIFFAFVYELCTKYCFKSLNKQSSWFQEQMNPFYIDFSGENSFGLQTFWVMKGIQKQIRFVNWGSTEPNINVRDLMKCLTRDSLSFWLCPTEENG